MTPLLLILLSLAAVFSVLGMSSVAAPPLSVKPRRFVSPARQYLDAILEPIHYPIYSTVALDNAAVLPREVLWFQYPIGGTVSGAGNGTIGGATLFHTNMESGGFFATPKIYLVQGIRIVPIPVTPGSVVGDAPTLRDPSTAAAVENSDQLDDYVLMWYTGTFKFQVGPKLYVQCPFWDLPSNTGIDGFAGVTTGLTTGWMRDRAFHPAGKYFGLPTYPIMIPPQQTFVASANWLLPTNATLIDDMWLVCQLDGISGREVM